MFRDSVVVQGLLASIAILCFNLNAINSERIVLGSFNKVHLTTSTSSSNGIQPNPPIVTINGEPINHRISSTYNSILNNDPQRIPNSNNHKIIVLNNGQDEFTTSLPNRQVFFTNFQSTIPQNSNLNRIPSRNPNPNVIFTTNLNNKDRINPNSHPNSQIFLTNLNHKDPLNQNQKITTVHHNEDVIDADTDENDSDQKIMLDDEIDEEDDVSDEDEDEDTANRIIGGRVVSIREVPWQAAIIRDGEFVCGGSVISSIWVLTAGHCIAGFGDRTHVVRVGSNRFRAGGELRRVGFLVLHGRYNATNFPYDIAMLRVARRFVFGLNVQPIGLATPESRNPEVFFVSGWGVTSQSGTDPSALLRGVSVNFVNRLACTALYSGTNFTLPRTSFCAGNLPFGARDSCQYDDGGALAYSAIQYGIVSYDTGCGRVRRPGVYTNVGLLAPWIVTVARTYTRRTFPDELDGYDIREVVIDDEDDGDMKPFSSSGIKIKVTSCLNCQSKE